MVDYHKSTGSSGTMMIRDTGSVVEFWITSGNGSTFAYDMPWAFVVNGVTSSWREFRYEAGAGYERLSSWTVSTSQTVTFKLGDTDTGGLGGPTNFSVAISRAKIPSPPTTVVLSSITSTSMHATFNDGANNGAAIDSRQIGYGVSPTAVITTVASDRSTDITGLTPGTQYYFWARTHNSLGYSGWAPRATATTLRVPDAPSVVAVTEVQQMSVHAAFTANGNGGSAILEHQIGYGFSATDPQFFVSSNGMVIGALGPGLKYYFWARVRNAVGWGPWSAVSSVTLIAGSHIKVGAVWKRAVPYVRIGGVWKVARPWGKSAGVWKETI